MISVAVSVIAALHFVLFAYFLFRTAITSPISDMFTYIADYLRFRTGQVGMLSYLWQPHGEHRLLWIRLLTWVDVELLHTRGLAFIAAATAGILATAALLWRRLWASEPTLGAPLALLAPMLILTTANAVDCSVPINVTYPITIFFAVSSIVLFADVEDRGRHASLRCTAAIGAAIGAGFATAAGLLVWPVLIWTGWRGRASYARLAAVVGIGCAYIIVYLHNLPPYGLAPALDMDAGAFLSTQHAWKLLDYFIGFLGLPLTREPALSPVGPAVGLALLLAGFSVIAVATFSQRLAKPLDRIAVGLIMLAIGAAALAAVGRSELVSEIPVRYTIFTSMLHVGLLYLLLPRCAQLVAGSPGSLLLYGTVVVLATALLVQQMIVGRIAERTAGVIARDAACFAQGRTQGPVNPAVTRTPAGSAAVITALKAQGLLPPPSTALCANP